MSEQLFGGIDYGRYLAVSRASIFNTAITANTPILTTSITVLVPARLMIYCAFSVAGVLSIIRTRGTVTVSEQLNAGATLTANASYMFQILIDSNDTVNLQYSVSATALVIEIQEMDLI